MNKSKIILGYFLGFFTSVILFLLVILLICKFTICNKNYFVNILKNNNYYEEIYNEINEEMELRLLSTGFTNEILKDIYTKEEVYEDIDIFFDNMYQGKKTILDKSNVRYNLKINIDNFFKETKLSVSNKDELDNFVNDLVDVYKDEICLYGYVDGVIVHFEKINKLINLGVIITSIIFIVLVFILLKLIKVKYFGSVIVASGLIILFIRLFVFEKIDVTDILIITEKFSIILRNILSNLQNIMYIVSIILIIIGIIISIFNSWCKVKKINKKTIENS